MREDVGDGGWRDPRIGKIEKSAGAKGVQDCGGGAVASIVVAVQEEAKVDDLLNVTICGFITHDLVGQRQTGMVRSSWSTPVGTLLLLDAISRCFD